MARCVGRRLDYARATALLLVALLRCIEYFTNIWFACLMWNNSERLSNMLCFCITCISLSLLVVLKICFALTSLAKKLENDYLRCDYPCCMQILTILSAFVSLDGFIWAAIAIRSQWGTNWNFVQDDRPGTDLGPRTVNTIRFLEGLLESFPLACIQMLQMLQSRWDGKDIERAQVLSCLSSCLLAAVAVRTLIATPLLRPLPTRHSLLQIILPATILDEVIVMLGVSSSTFLRISSFAIVVRLLCIVGDNIYQHAWVWAIVVWWVVSFSFSLIMVLRKRSENDLHITLDGVVLLACFLAYVYFTPMFMQILLMLFGDTNGPARYKGLMLYCCDLLREIEVLTVAIMAILWCPSHYRVRGLSISVVVIWPLHMLARCRIDSVVLKYGIPCVHGILSTLRVDFDGRVVDEFFAKCCGRLCGSCCLRGDVRALDPLVMTLVPNDGQGPERDAAWHDKVNELSQRGFTLQSLLKFYGTLGTSECMPWFSPSGSTTNDVVRGAIIPVSRGTRHADGKALATVLENGPLIPTRLVSHTWSNPFANTVAAIIADALNESTYDHIVDKLRAGTVTVGDPPQIISSIEFFEGELKRKGTLKQAIWFCALSVNQHSSICGRFAPGSSDSDNIDSVTCEFYSTCDCGTPKYLNESALCEIDKFDDMLAVMIGARRSDFRLVVAVDPEFVLFTRIWCVAELVECRQKNIQINLKLPSSESLIADRARLTRLRRLRVQECKATRPEDVEYVLSKIGDNEAQNNFNRFLEILLFGENGLFTDIILHQSGRDATLGVAYIVRIVAAFLAH